MTSSVVEPLHRLAGGRLLAAIGLGLGVVLAGFAGVVLGGWWWLPLAIGLLLALTAAVVGVAFDLLSQVEAPDPRTTARLQDRGVADPERKLNDEIERAGGRPAGQRVRRLFEERTGELEPATGDTARAAREQQAAWTPSSGSSRPAGSERGDR